MKVITHLHVVPRLRMRGIYPYTPSNSFMVWCFITQGTNLPKPLGVQNCYLIFSEKLFVCEIVICVTELSLNFRICKSVLTTKRRLVSWLSK